MPKLEEKRKIDFYTSTMDKLLLVTLKIIENL